MNYFKPQIKSMIKYQEKATGQNYPGKGLLKTLKMHLRNDAFNAFTIM